jgi:hypothetical protein
MASTTAYILVGCDYLLSDNIIPFQLYEACNVLIRDLLKSLKYIPMLCWHVKYMFNFEICHTILADSS